MGIWRDLKAGVQHAAAGLEFMARGEREGPLPGSAEWEAIFGPDEPEPEPDFGYRYHHDGRITTHDGRELDTGWSPGTVRPSRQAQREP
jgi:hypothetical protein